jgi:hypothetical protein
LLKVIDKLTKDLPSSALKKKGCSMLIRYFIVSIVIFSVSFAGSWVFEKNGPKESNVFLFPGVDDDKPAEEVYKNIQVLKGMPSKDLHMVMHFMRASLGVRCSFCHVHDDKTNKWIWESDDKEEKNTARKMITMVRGINKDYFEGSNAVSCITCHNGHSNITRTPPLPQVNPAPRNDGKDTTLPSAESVISQYNKSIGDISKIKTAASRYSKGTITTYDGKVFDLEVYQQPSNKFLQVVKTPDGSDLIGYDGISGWEKNPKGAGELDGYELANIKEYSNYTGDLDLNGRYSKMQVIGKDTVKGKAVYVVRALVDSLNSERLYFDIDSGLLLRRKIFSLSIIGNIPRQTDYSDYRLVEGVMMPFTIHYSYLDPFIETERKYSEIVFNKVMDNVSFSRP